MAISVKIFLDKRHAKKDQAYPIKLRLTINRKLIEIASGYSVPEKY